MLAVTMMLAAAILIEISAAPTPTKVAKPCVKLACFVSSKEVIVSVSVKSTVITALYSPPGLNGGGEGGGGEGG